MAGVRAHLEAAADGLRYVSETDAPFRWVSFAAGPPGPLSAEWVARTLAVSPAEVEEVSLEQFFAGHIEEADPADAAAQQAVPRFERLREALRSELRDPRVFRVGHVQIRCLVLGRLDDGSAAGLETQVLET